MCAVDAYATTCDHRMEHPLPIWLERALMRDNLRAESSLLTSISRQVMTTTSFAEKGNSP
jgi:hypothetical protein